MAAVVFVVALALGAVWLVAGRGRGAEPAPAGGAVASAPAPSGPAASGGGSAAGSVCGMDAGPQTPPSGAPAFELLRVSSVLSVPVVDGAGPGITDGITRCFAHSPTGAVVAAVNFMRWLSSRERLPEVVDVLMEPSGDRDRMAQQVQSGWDGSKARAVTIRGYRTQVRGADEVSHDGGLHRGGAGIDANEHAAAVALEAALGDDLGVVARLKLLVGDLVGKEGLKAGDLRALCVLEVGEGVDDILEAHPPVGLSGETTVMMTQAQSIIMSRGMLT